MNNREWIEIGKMWETMIKADYELNLFHHHDDINLYKIIAHKLSSGRVCDSDWFSTPYLATKELYFRDYLNQTGNEYVDFDLDEELYNSLCQGADDRGITIDEFVAEILQYQMAIMIQANEKPSKGE